VHYAAMTGIAYLVISRRGGWLFTLLYVGFFVIVEIRILLLPQFTTTAFLAGMAGLLLLVDGLLPTHPVNWSKVIIGILFLSVMCLIREQVALLCGAIAGPFFLERLGLKEWKRLLGTALACIALFASLQGINHWAYHRDPAWAEFSEYNYMRGELNETPLGGLIPKAAPAVGWTENDAWLFSHFYFPDRDVYPGVFEMRVSKMRDLLDKVNTLQQEEPTQSVPSVTKSLFLPKMYLSYPGNSGHSAWLMNLAILNAIWCTFVARILRRRIATVLLIYYAIFWLLGCYLLTTGRLPERVAYNFPLFINAIFLYWATGFQNLTATEPTRANWLEYYTGRLWRTRTLRFAALVSVSVWAFSYLASVSILTSTLVAVNSYYQNVKYISQEICPSIRTLLPVPAGKTPLLLTFPSDSLLESSLFSYRSAERGLFFEVPAYGWSTQSPLLSRILERHHLDSYSLSVVDRPDIFFLMKPEWIAPLKMFYHEHYGLGIRFDMVLNTDDMPQFKECQTHLYHARIDDGTTSHRVGQ
jgi:hypothetical protein